MYIDVLKCDVKTDEKPIVRKIYEKHHFSKKKKGQRSPVTGLDGLESR
jgi:hypothetical protein